MYNAFLFLFVSIAIYLVTFSTNNRSAFILNFRYYILVEYILLVTYFYYLLHNQLIKKLIIYSIIPFFILWVINYFTSASNQIDNFLPITQFLVFLIIIVTYFVSKMLENSSIVLHKQISFWVCVGLFIHFSGNFFFYLLISSIDKTKDALLFSQMLSITSIINILKDIILALAWLAHERTETPNDKIVFPEGVDFDEPFPFISKPTTT